MELGEFGMTRITMRASLLFRSALKQLEVVHYGFSLRVLGLDGTDDTCAWDEHKSTQQPVEQGFVGAHRRASMN